MLADKRDRYCRFKKFYITLAERNRCRSLYRVSPCVIVVAMLKVAMLKIVMLKVAVLKTTTNTMYHYHSHVCSRNHS